MNKLELNIEDLQDTYNSIRSDANRLVLENNKPSSDFIKLVHNYFLFGINYSESFLKDKVEEVQELCNNLTILNILPMGNYKNAEFDKNYTSYFKITTNE